MFEISAKSLAEKDFDFGKDNKEILEKLNELIGQNKTIARGVTLIHEKPYPSYSAGIKQEQREEAFQIENPPMPTKPLPKTQIDFSQRIKRIFPQSTSAQAPRYQQSQNISQRQPLFQREMPKNKEYQESITEQDPFEQTTQETQEQDSFAKEISSDEFEY